MIDPVKTRAFFRAPVPVSKDRRLPCGTCGQAVDPLRASRVAIFEERFLYFCSPTCRERFVPSLLPPPPRPPSETGLRVPGVARLSGSKEAESVRSETVLQPRPLSPPSWLDAGVLLGLVAAVSSTSLGAPLPRWVGPAVAAAACAAVIRGALTQRATDEAGDRFAASIIAPLVATLSAWGSLLLHPVSHGLTVSVAGIVCAVAAASLVLLARRSLTLAPERAHVERALSPRGRGVERGSHAESGRDEKPGQELLLQAGDQICVDAVVAAGRATVSPWLGSRSHIIREEGDALLAGAEVVDGALRAVVRWVGPDRAWARLTTDPQRRADRHTALAKLAERLASSGAGALGLVTFAAALSFDLHLVVALSYAAAAGASIGNVALPGVMSLYISRGVYRLLRRGISFRNATALDRAGRTATVVFCAQGTLLTGEFSVASIEPAGQLGPEQLSSLLAGAYAGLSSPVGVALLRSAQAQNVRPDATRSPSYLPGLGVTAVASNGQALVVGTRALLLERRISVASAEAHIAELEALGRSVLLVALDGRWVGLVALQDSLHPGARAAVQHLLDAHVEPVLLSGESRETCRALARHMGIEHVRPEVLPEERAPEIRRLSQNGTTLAVVGRGATDDAALAAAPLSINVDSTGGPLERWDVDVTSGDVRDAAAAVQLARQLHTDARRALVTVTAPAAAAFSMLSIGAPAWLLPLTGFVGAALALKRLRSVDG